MENIFTCLCDSYNVNKVNDLEVVLVVVVSLVSLFISTLDNYSGCLATQHS
jgi:hypothetical protein